MIRIFFFFISLLILASFPASLWLWQDQTQKHQALQARQSAILAQENVLQKDMREAQKLAASLTLEEQRKLLAPLCPSPFLKKLERLAAAQSLSSFQADLQPQSKKDEKLPPTITSYTLTIKADAPDDARAFAFLNAVRNSNGRFDLTNLTLERKNNALHLAAQFHVYGVKCGE